MNMHTIKTVVHSLWEVAEVIVIALVTVFLIRNFLLQPFLVSGSSMEPNFSSGDYLLIDEISYKFREPKRGEVIVFHYPKDESTYYIKRVIGLPGEKVVLEKGTITIVNNEHPGGFKLEEGYLPGTIETTESKEAVLGPTEYFVMGDNRQYSFDSRSWGSLSEKEIVGVVRVRLWPFNKVMAIGQPSY